MRHLCKLKRGINYESVGREFESLRAHHSPHKFSSIKKKGEAPVRLARSYLR